MTELVAACVAPATPDFRLQQETSVGSPLLAARRHRELKGLCRILYRRKFSPARREDYYNRDSSEGPRTVQECSPTCRLIVTNGSFCR